MGIFEIQADNGRLLEIEAASPQEAASNYNKLKALAAEEDKPTSLPELTGGFVTRGAMEAVGGTLGAVAGSAGGLAGAIGGGALGVAGGSLAFDNIEDFLKFTGLLGGERTTGVERLKETTGTAARSAATDVAVTGGVMGAAQGIRALKPIVGRILGVGGEAVGEILNQAKRAGLTKEGTPQLGAMDVAPGARGVVARGTMKVFGGFPFIGSPMRRAAISKAETVVERINSTLNAFSPSATMADDLGVDMMKAAKESNARFRTTAGRLYDNFRQLARAQGEIVPTAPIKAKVAEVVDIARRQEVTLSDGSKLSGDAADSMNDMLEKWDLMPDFITIDQLQGQADRLKNIVDQARASGFDVSRFMPFKKGMEEALSSLNLSGLDEATARQITDAKQAADSFFSKGITLFQRPTGQKLGRVDKNVLKIGADTPGSLSPDEIAGVATNLKSPQAIRDLAELVGPENMGKAARLHMERAWNDSLLFKDGELRGVDWNAFRRNMGLQPTTGIQKAESASGARELIRQGGVDPKQIEDLIDVASRIELPKDINQFIARRAALGGIQSAVSAVTLSKLFGEGVLGSVGAGLLLRHFGRIVVEPQQLQALRRVMTPSGDVNMKRAILAKFIEGIPGAMDEINQVIKRQRDRDAARKLLGESSPAGAP